MGQLRLFPTKRKPNTTLDGELACAFGTPWAQHFTAAGCAACDAWSEEGDATLEDQPGGADDDGGTNCGRRGVRHHGE